MFPHHAPHTELPKHLLARTHAFCMFQILISALVWGTFLLRKKEGSQFQRLMVSPSIICASGGGDTSWSLCVAEKFFSAQARN